MLEDCTVYNTTRADNSKPIHLVLLEVNNIDKGSDRKTSAFAVLVVILIFICVCVVFCGVLTFFRREECHRKERSKDVNYQTCNFCSNSPSVSKCCSCNVAMCAKCSFQHGNSDNTSGHIVQHEQDTYKLDYTFEINVEAINDTKVLHDGLLVIADYWGQQLVTCRISENQRQQYTIPLHSDPWRIAIIDNNTVAVRSTSCVVKHTFLTSTVLIVDVIKRKVLDHIDVKVVCYGIMYRDKQLFLGCDDKTIKIITISGEVTRAIKNLDAIPRYMCGSDSKRIYYTDYEKVYCVDTEGNSLFIFSDPNMSKPTGLTKDNKGHTLVICQKSKNVLRISPDGKQIRVSIAQIPTKAQDEDGYSYIFYYSQDKSLITVRNKLVNVYKKV